MHPVAAADSALAVSEAWERGLLRPGIADVRFLDWSTTPSNLVALVKAWVEIAQAGVLSVIWPLLDQLIAAALRAAKLLAGSAELVEAIGLLLPEVRAAVAKGLAPANALDLPGLRALADRPGNSRAVSLAGQISAQLPAPVEVVTAVSAETSLDPAFDQLWPAAAGQLPAVFDQASLSAGWVDSGASKLLYFDLVLPEEPGYRFRVVKKDWHYDLTAESQCQAKQWPVDQAEISADAPTVWLHWDAQSGRLVVETHRDWLKGKDGPLSAGERSALSTTLVAVAVGLLGNGANSGSYLIRQLVEHNQIGAAAVTAAIRTLLRSPAVSPARLVKILEDNNYLLPYLWPLLTEPIRLAATMGSPPAWLSRVIGAALLHAPYLVAAADRGYLPAEVAGWPGLAQIAAWSGSSAAIAKAKRLLTALHFN
jgi:hypothetical protein